MTEEITISKVNFKEQELDREYYKCIFENCDFSNKTIANISFENCSFKQCNFSLTKLNNYFSNAKFIGCKMTGTDFSGISKFSGSLHFEDSYMNYASFFGIKIRKSHFINCTLNEAFFEETDIAFCVFKRCDLIRATFFQTNLEKTDFSTSYNFSINPNTNKLKKTIFPISELKGLVAHLDIIIKDVD